jgi:CRP-like cAMP-binding protein
MTISITELFDHPEFHEGHHWHRERFQPKQFVLKEGDRTARLYVVLAGTVRVLGTVDLETGRQIRPGINDLGEGEVFGELALFDERPHCATVSAISETELAVIEGPLFLEFLDEHREIGYSIFKSILCQLVPRLRKTDASVFSLLAWGLKAHELDKL